MTTYAIDLSYDTEMYSVVGQLPLPTHCKGLGRESDVSEECSISVQDLKVHWTPTSKSKDLPQVDGLWTCSSCCTIFQFSKESQRKK